MVPPASADELDITIRSHRLHARRFGSPSAPLAVAVHGLTGNCTTFDFIGERLGGDALQIVAIDLRGRGRSEVTAAGSYGWEEHARDVVAVADELDAERFVVIGASMGGSVAMKVAELDGSRLAAAVLIDIAGRVDRGVAPVIASVMAREEASYLSVEEYVDAIRASGLVEPWTGYWDRFARYQLRELDGGLRSRADHGAVAEDRAYTGTQDPYARWKHLTMPVLLLRAERELVPGAGHVVPAADRDAFLRRVPNATVVEIAANHLTIAMHADGARAIARFLGVA